MGCLAVCSERVYEAAVTRPASELSILTSLLENVDSPLRLMPCMTAMTSPFESTTGTYTELNTGPRERGRQPSPLSTAELKPLAVNAVGPHTCTRLRTTASRKIEGISSE